MDGFATVGQPGAVAAVRAMLGSHVPHAVLLAGPPSVGKHALAMDLAAALLCTGAEGGARPCRTCRGCRMVEHGNHPDLHRLEPEGAGGQIRIGDRQHPEPGTVRGLAVELALLPVEGGARVAIVRDAQRMNDDAQSALLKTLEEPPAGTTLILCADDEERLLPTVRSRCARIRLGPVGVRDIEELLAGRELADPPTAARLARLAAGRPGLAVAYAVAPEAEAIRGEISRVLLDLVPAPRATRLRAARELLTRAGGLAAVEGPQPVRATAPRAARPRGCGARAGPSGGLRDARRRAGRDRGRARAQGVGRRAAPGAGGSPRRLAGPRPGSRPRPARRRPVDPRRRAARGAAGHRGCRPLGRLRGVPRAAAAGGRAARRQREPGARPRRPARPLAGRCRGARRRSMTGVFRR